MPPDAAPPALAHAAHPPEGQGTLLTRGSAKRYVAKTLLLSALVSWVVAGLAALLHSHPEWAAGVAGLFHSTPEQVLAAQSGLAAMMWYLAGGGVLLLALVATLGGRRREWERILELILIQRGLFRRMLWGSFLLVIAELSLPMMLYVIVGGAVQGQHDLRLLWILLAVLGAILLLRAVAGYLRQYCAQALAYSIAGSLRVRIFAHLQRLNFSFFDRARQGELMSTATNDVEKLQFFLANSSEDFFVAPLKVYIALACVFFVKWKLALVIFATLIPIGLCLRYTSKRLRQVNEAAQEWLGKLTAELAESINTVRLAQSFGLESKELGRFRDTNHEALRKLLTNAQIGAVLVPSIELLSFFGPLAVIALLCIQAIQNHTTLDTPALLAIAGYGGMVANPLGKLSRIMATLGQGEAASRRIHGVLDTRSEIVDKPGALTIDDCQGAIAFDNVTLQYGAADIPALREFSLVVHPGEVVAFVGESGSGKSSVVHLVPRFYDPTAGRVLLDGHDLRDLALASLRGHTAIVSQDTILVHGTVRENIAYGAPGADEKDIIDAAISANAHNFIIEFPQGYDTLVGERGVTLSGGQRQRIAIARALLRDPQILLLDEATSALDTVSEAIVQAALDKLMFGRTTLLVAHRLSTIRHANRIVVLRQGRIAEMGTHAELLAAGGEYARLIKLQGE